MKIVVDTNVIISASFFGGEPLRVLEIIIGAQAEASATEEIVAEYQEAVDKTINRGQGHFNPELFGLFLNTLDIVPVLSTTDICRDPTDNKFLSCAKDVKALFIVSGDNDLLSIEEFEGVHIITVKQFLNAFHMNNGSERCRLG